MGLELSASNSMKQHNAYNVFSEKWEVENEDLASNLFT